MVKRSYEESPAYRVLRDMLEDKYRNNCASDLDLISSNSTVCANLLSVTCCDTFAKQFVVTEGCLRAGEDGAGKYLFFGPGVHKYNNMFGSVAHYDTPLTEPFICNGNRCIVTIKQGYIGYAEDMGQPVLLPPGLHEWESNTLKFIESIDLNNTMIHLGPYTLLTVDEGYAAITQNNGEQVVLPGGKTHLLTHRNWKFEKFMTEKIQTDDLQRIEATSADNVMMHTDATVVWRVSDVLSAARMSAETMRKDGCDVKTALGSDIAKLRNDVLKQATASLAAFIGGIRYSDSFHVAARAAHASASCAVGLPASSSEANLVEGNHIFNAQRMAGAVETANTITNTYGVTIVSINIISATPADSDLQVALAKGAVASAEAEQAETIAQGQAKAARILAQGEADAERIRAEGSRAAADMLAESAIAVELARIDRTGAALGDKATLFFGADPKHLEGLLSNPGVVNLADR